MYIVISKPKRISWYWGLFHFITQTPQEWKGSIDRKTRHTQARESGQTAPIRVHRERMSNDCKTCVTPEAQFAYGKPL